MNDIIRMGGSEITKPVLAAARLWPVNCCFHFKSSEAIMRTKEELEGEIREERAAVLVVNTHSRRGRKAFAKSVSELTKAGIEITASYAVNHPKDLPAIVAGIMGEAPKLLILGGGDGTISSVVDYLTYTSTVLGILPLGTSNAFARTLGIQLTLEGAIDVIKNGKVVDVDLGKVDDDYFANVASIGLSAEIAKDRPDKLKRFFGVLAFVAVGIKHLLSHRAFQCTITADGKEHRLKTHQVVIVNGSYFGVTRVEPRANPDDRCLLIYTMDTLSRLKLIEIWLAFIQGKQQVFSQVRRIATKEARIETVPHRLVDVDGEMTVRTPVRFSIAAQALKVLAPAEFEDR